MNIAIIESLLRRKLLITAAIVAATLLSAYAIFTAPLDAIPDISDPQIVLYAKWARSPQLLESQVTEPLIKSLSGTSGIQTIRSTSHMGYSFIYVILKSESQRAVVQKSVTDRLNTIRPQLPQDAIITLGPNAAASVRVAFHELPDGEGVPRAVCQITAEASPRPVYLKPNKNSAPELWVRAGNSTRQLAVDSATEYVMHRWPLSVGSGLAAQFRAAMRFSEAS